MNFLESMDALNKAGVMPWHVEYDRRLDFLNARAEEFVAANPKTRADWFEPLQAVFEAQQSFVFGGDSPIWYRGGSGLPPLLRVVQCRAVPGDGGGRSSW